MVFGYHTIGQRTASSPLTTKRKPALPSLSCSQRVCVENQSVLDKVSVEKKSNDITAATELLDLVDVKSNIITANAKNCQKEITRKLRAKEVDYVIVLKG